MTESPKTATIKKPNPVKYRKLVVIPTCPVAMELADVATVNFSLIPIQE
jgi:hypothetical protein